MLEKLISNGVESLDELSELERAVAHGLGKSGIISVYIHGGFHVNSRGLVALADYKDAIEAQNSAAVSSTPSSRVEYHVGNVSGNVAVGIQGDVSLNQTANNQEADRKDDKGKKGRPENSWAKILIPALVGLLGVVLAAVLNRYPQVVDWFVGLVKK